MRNNLDYTHEVIRTTGCCLDEALSIKVSDFVVNGHGDVCVRLSRSKRIGTAFRRFVLLVKTGNTSTAPQIPEP